jgi:hypothetical protein
MKKKLILKKEALKNLSPAALDQVVGGASNVSANDPTSVSCNFL